MSAGGGRALYRVASGFTKQGEEGHGSGYESNQERVMTNVKVTRWMKEEGGNKYELHHRPKLQVCHNHFLVLGFLDLISPPPPFSAYRCFRE